MDKLKRYDLVTNYRCGDAIEELEVADEGEWVKYEDMLQILHDLLVTLTYPDEF